MEVTKTRGKPDLEVLLSAGLVALMDSCVSDHAYRSFGLLISPALAFYVAMIVSQQSSDIKLLLKQRRYDRNIAAAIKTLEKEYCDTTECIRKAEILEELKKLREARFTNEMQKINFSKPDYQKAAKMRKNSSF